MRRAAIAAASNRVFGPTDMYGRFRPKPVTIEIRRQWMVSGSREWRRVGKREWVVMTTYVTSRGHLSYSSCHLSGRSWHYNR